MELARELVLSSLPGAEPVWLGDEARDERRVDVFLAEPGGRVLLMPSLSIDGTFVPDVVARCPFVAYDPAAAEAHPDATIGVLAWAVTVHSSGATQVRFDWQGRILTVRVKSGHCLFITWDTPWPRQETKPRPGALLIARIWQASVSGIVAATAVDFRASCRAFHDSQARDDWASCAFFDDGKFADKRAMIEAVLDDPGLSTLARGYLAAGLGENLMGHELLDHATASAEARARGSRSCGRPTGRRSRPRCVGACRCFSAQPTKRHDERHRGSGATDLVLCCDRPC